MIPLAQRLLEMPMDTGGHPNFTDRNRQQAISKRQHPLANNPAFPDYQKQPGHAADNFEEYLASEQYKQTCDKLNRYMTKLTGKDWKLSSPQQMMEVMGMGMEVLMEIKEIEEDYKYELEDLAMSVVFQLPEFRAYAEPHENGEFQIVARLGQPSMKGAKLSNGQECLVSSAQAGGVELKWKGEVPVIEATAVIFPVLVQEVVKGLMELASVGSLPTDPEAAGHVIDKADLADHETWSILMGRGLWNQLINLLDTNEDELTMHLYDYLVRLPTAEFNSTMKILQGGGDKAKAVIKKLVNQIRVDMEHQHRDEAGFGESTERFLVAFEEAEDLSGEVMKRQLINALIQGSAISKNYAFHLAQQELDEINPKLVKLYGVIMALAELQYFVVPEEMQQMMYRGR